LTVKLGNLLPGQHAILKSTIVSQLEVVGGHYAFVLPVAFYPDYKKHGAAQVQTYDFAYEVRIRSESRVSNLSLPVHAAIVEQNETHSSILIRSTQVARSIELFYRTADMLLP